MKLLLNFRNHSILLSHGFHVLKEFSESLYRIYEIFEDPGYISADYRDIRLDLDKYDEIQIASGVSDGEHRISKAIHDALNTEILLSNVMNANQVIIKFLCSSNSEYHITAEELMSDVVSFTRHLKNVKWSIAEDASLDHQVRVIIFATGFENSEQESEKDLTKVGKIFYK